MHNRNPLLFVGAVFALNLSASADAQSSSKASVPKPFTASEKSQGAKYHTEILKEFGGAMQSPQTGYVTRVGKTIAVQSRLGNSESDFNITLLNSSVNNAFAIPGGYVYITRQLVALCNSEAEMAGVLGHEVGHTAARHSAKRQKNATLASILGVGGSILGALLGNQGGVLGALGGGLQQYSGTVAQLFNLKYSRKQEEQADDLGIRYLSTAGYDPQALSSMLTALALQTAVDARVSGNTSGAIPAWASTHPDPAKRVTRAATKARTYPASGVRNAESHLSAINGMLYGDDPEQGVVEGQSFLHPDLRMKFTVPNGFGLQNGANSIAISGNSGQAIFAQGQFNGNRETYVAAALKSISGEQTIPAGQISRTTINGIPAFYSTSIVNTQQGQRRVTVFAYEWGGDTGYHFTTITAGNSDVFGSMYQSMERLTSAEAGAIKPRRLRVVTVVRNDSIGSLANRMAYTSLQTERFMALNGMPSASQLTAGQKVKIVTY